MAAGAKRNRSLIRRPRGAAVAVTCGSVVCYLALTSNIISGPDGGSVVRRNPGEPTPAPEPAIDRIGLDGSVTSFPVPIRGSSGSALQIVLFLTNGPDGNVWFGRQLRSTFHRSRVVIGKVIAGRSKSPSFPDFHGRPDNGLNGQLDRQWARRRLLVRLHVRQPQIPRLRSQEFIGQVTTTGAITLFPDLYSFGSNSPLFVDSITPGADGNLWFTEGMVKHFVCWPDVPDGVAGSRSVLPGDVANGPNNGHPMTRPRWHQANDEVFDQQKTSIPMLRNLVSIYRATGLELPTWPANDRSGRRSRTLSSETSGWKFPSRSHRGGNRSEMLNGGCFPDDGAQSLSQWLPWTANITKASTAFQQRTSRLNRRQYPQLLR